MKQPKRECHYCGEAYVYSSNRLKPLSVKLNGHGLCRDCRKRFPDGCNGVTFENDLERYEKMIMGEDKNNIYRRRSDTDWLPSGERVR